MSWEAAFPETHPVLLLLKEIKYGWLIKIIAHSDKACMNIPAIHEIKTTYYDKKLKFIKLLKQNP